MRSKLSLIALAAAFALMGCKRQDDPNTIRFRYWGDLEESKIVEGMLKDFEASHPGIRVKAERKPADNSYADGLMAEFAAGRAPDVIFAVTDCFDVLAQGGKFMDLDPFLAADPELKRSDFYPSSLERFTTDGHLRLLPRDIAPMACVYYNKALFDEAKLPYPKDDWTWDELRETAIKLTKRGKDGLAQQYGFADDWNLTDAWILAGGGRAVDDFYQPKRFTFAEGGALDGILFRWKLQQKDRVMPSSSDNQSLNGGASALFMDGKLALFHSGPWKTPAFRKISKFKWDVARFPKRRGAKPLYYSGGSGFGIREGAKNPAACWQLVRTMAGPVGQKQCAATGLAMPALKALAASPAFLDGQDPRNKKMLLACAESAQASPAWVPWIEFGRTLWGPTTDPIWIRGYGGDPAVLLKDLQAKANAKFFPAN